MRKEEQLTILDEKEIEKNKELFTEMSKKIIHNENYQRTLFILLCIATYACTFLFSNFPSQKNLPDFVCLTFNQNDLILSGLELDSGAEIGLQSKQMKNKIYENYSTLFTPKINNYDKIKIIKNEKCVNLYCNQDREVMNNLTDSKLNVDKENFFGILIANYESITNYVTEYDSMCDYESFFSLINTIINLSRIFGSLYFSNLSDRSGRLIAFKCNVFIMLVNYLFIFIFSSSRIFFYLFIFFSAINLYLYFLIIAMASETMNQTYFSLLNTAMSAIFSVSGIVALLTMVFIKNIFYLYYLQLILIIVLVYYSNKYVLETFSFLIEKNLFKESLMNLHYLNTLMDLKIHENPDNKEKLYRLESFVRKFSNIHTDIEKLDINNQLAKFQEVKKVSINKKIELLELDDFYNSKKVQLISDKTYEQNFSLKDDINKFHNSSLEKNEFLQKINKNDLSEVSEKNNIMKNSINFNEHKLQHKSSNIIFDKVNIKDKTAENKYYLEDLKKKTIFQIKNMIGPYIEIFKNPKYFWTYIKFLPIYITVNVIYYGQIFNVEKLSDDVYVTTFIIFIAEFIGEFIAGMIMHNSERKKILNLCLFVNGVLYFIAIFTENIYIRYLVTFGGSIFITIAFIALYIFAAESYDIEIKNSLTSLLSNSSCLFMIFFPYILKLLPNIFVIFSFICFSSMNMTRYFEETFKNEH